MPYPPVFSQMLPAATPGRFKRIGYAYLRTQPTRTVVYPTPTFKSSDTPVLRLEQVGYAVFYPCEMDKPGPGVHWLPRPVGDIVIGYQRFLGNRGISWLVNALRLFVGGLKFPARQNDHLSSAQSKYPLAIFSHGIAGTRHTYTQFVSALASEGYVVLVVEHRDGTGPAVTMPNGEKTLHYVPRDGVSWPNGEEHPLLDFRMAQLNMRTREVYETVHSFKQIVQGQEEIAKSRPVDIDGLEDEQQRKEWAATFRDRIDFDNLTLTGHSFGGGTVLNIIQTDPPEGFDKLPIKHVVALDPWLEPMAVPTAQTKPPIDPPPLLVLNSPGFTQWDKHFDRLVDLVKASNGSLLTILGSNHQTFSDFPLLSPASPTPALTLLSRIHDLTNAFLNDSLSESPLITSPPDDGEIEKTPDGKIAHSQPTKGQVVAVHLLANANRGASSITPVPESALHQ